MLLNNYLFNVNEDGFESDAKVFYEHCNMIKNRLDECLKLGIDRVLMTCNKTNVASKKSIIKNSGVKENEVVDDFEILERYWIDVNDF